MTKRTLSVLHLRCRDDPRTKRPHGVRLRLRLERGEPITADRHLRVERLDQATERQFPLGNRQTGTIVDTFWLDGPLEISAVEEARFVTRLAQQKLDASIRSQSIARDIIRLESRDGKILYGKTGWRFSSAPNLGWWTGWVERNGKISAFSLNIDMPAATDAPKRVAVGKAMLSKLGIL
jgi:beta-lactamase class D